MGTGSWTFTKRNYHGEKQAALTRWIVHRRGELRGICECFTESGAEQIVKALKELDPK